MEQVTSKVMTRAIDSVRLPMEHFYKHGVYDPHAIEGWQEADLSSDQVSRACRVMSKELKRPFIRCHDVVSYKGQQWVYGLIEVPRRKYLVPHIAPLTLAGENSPAVRNFTRPTLWTFHVYDRELWNDYYKFVMNDPDLRRARKLIS